MGLAAAGRQSAGVCGTLQGSHSLGKRCRRVRAAIGETLLAPRFELLQLSLCVHLRHAEAHRLHRGLQLTDTI